MLKVDNRKVDNWKCPKHGLRLRTIEDYPDALLCPAGARYCPDIFTIIKGRLCKSLFHGNQWEDVKTGEVREII